MTRTVAIVQRRLTHYRVPLFERMRGELRNQNIRLRLLHGDPSSAEASKNDSGNLAWAERLETHYALGGRLLWQPFMHHLTETDLVIVTQENKHLHNLPAVFNPWRKVRLAFWGHGRNMQSVNAHSLAERFKRLTTARVDWWFAYTNLSASAVCATGFAPNRVTVLNNSIDTTALKFDLTDARKRTESERRQSFGLGYGPVATFIGSLYSEKRIEFLLDASISLHSQLPGFQLVIAGAGPKAAAVQDASGRMPWLRFLGPVHGLTKAELLSVSDVIVNPGLVGLGILDGFVAGLPMITTDCGLHSPEIAYLKSGQNGLMTPNDRKAFVKGCLDVLGSPTLRANLSAGASLSAGEYSMENMSRNFCNGIDQALSAH